MSVRFDTCLKIQKRKECYFPHFDNVKKIDEYWILLSGSLDYI